MFTTRNCMIYRFEFFILVSDCFPMKDTKRYYRAYVEVEKTTDMLRKMNNESNDDVPETSYFGTGTRYNK